MALPFLRARPRVASGLERVICLDDPPNQLVTDNIGPSQMDKADVCDVRQNLLDVGEPATLDGKVSLGGITAMEAIVDLATQELHPLAKRAKDIAAASVYVLSLTAAVVGAIVFSHALGVI